MNLLHPVKDRISRLRKEMADHDYQAYLVTGTDPHKSEYPAPRWNTRAYLSGFTGSAGTLLITREKAGLWTDSRYYLQAEKELENTGITLFREEEPEVPSPQSWLRQELSPGGILGFEEYSTPWSLVQTWEAVLSPIGCKIALGPDLLEHIWQDRPEAPANLIWDLESAFRGLEPRRHKLEALRKALGSQGADFLVLNTLDDIAWLTNLRGEDIEYNPLFLSFAYIDDTRAELFTQPQALSLPLQNRLEDEGWLLKPYKDIFQTLRAEPIQRPHRGLPRLFYGLVQP